MQKEEDGGSRRQAAEGKREKREKEEGKRGRTEGRRGGDERWKDLTRSTGISWIGS